MRLLDQFAMSALAGLLANPHSNKDDAALARSAYQMARAMMAERSKEGNV